MKALDFSRVTVGPRRPHRPWDIRARQWLLRPSVMRVLAPLLATLVAVALFAVAFPEVWAR